mgnify:CR=1 FL=1
MTQPNLPTTNNTNTSTMQALTIINDFDETFTITIGDRVCFKLDIEQGGVVEGINVNRATGREMVQVRLSNGESISINSSSISIS